MFAETTRRTGAPNRIPQPRERHRGRRRGVLSLALLLLSLASCAGMASDAAERLEAELDATQQIRVMAYNIKHGQGMDRKVDLERIAAVINEQQPDVVTLQEVDRNCGRSSQVDQAARLGELCGMQHAFGTFMDYDGGQYGMALLSRLPIVEVTNHVLPPGTEPRSALAARIRLEEAGSDVVVVGIHFYRTEAERLAQAKTLAKIYQQAAAPVILAGDFNSRRGDPIMEWLERDWVTAAKSGDSNTFPSNAADREIDFVMLRPATAFEVLHHSVIAEPMASDHLPLIIDLQISPQGNQPRGNPR